MSVSREAQDNSRLGWRQLRRLVVLGNSEGGRSAELQLCAAQCIRIAQSWSSALRRHLPVTGLGFWSFPRLCAILTCGRSFDRAARGETSTIAKCAMNDKLLVVTDLGSFKAYRLEANNQHSTP